MANSAKIPPKTIPGYIVTRCLDCPHFAEGFELAHAPDVPNHCDLDPTLADPPSIENAEVVPDWCPLLIEKIDDKWVIDYD